MTLKNGHDEAAVLLNFWATPTRVETAQQSSQPPLDRWREVTAWLAHDGGVVIFSEEAHHVTGSGGHCLRETRDEIGRLALLEENWNDEGAPTIDRASMLRAQKFVQWLDCVAWEQNLTGDCAPSVFPAISGGVKLYWNIQGHQISLTFHPGENTIEVVEKRIGLEGSRRRVAENEAGPVALEAMRTAI